MTSEPEQDLIDAVKRGDLERVKSLLLDEPERVNTRSGDGVSALMLATYYGHRQVVETLLSTTALQLNVFEASASGQIEKLKSIVTHAPDSVNSYSPDGFTPLGFAAFFGHAIVVDYLLEQGADANLPARNQMAVMPLHSALANTNRDAATAITRALLIAGAKVNVRQQGGWTPLHEAVAQGYLELVKLLLDLGADVNAENDDGKAALYLAQTAKQDDVAALLIEHGAEQGTTNSHETDGDVHDVSQSR